MKKNLNISIEIDTEYDTPQNVKDLIRDLLKTCGDRTFAIDSATIDGQEVFKINVGFCGVLKRRMV